MANTRKSLTSDMWWCHFSRELITSGVMAKIPSSAVKVYLVLKTHVSSNTGFATISLDFIAEKAGVSRETVKRSVGQLIKLGLVKSSPRAGRPSDYEIFEIFQIRDEGGSVVGVATYSYSGAADKQQRSELSCMFNSGLLESMKGIQVEAERKVVCAAEYSEQLSDLERIPVGIRKKLERNYPHARSSRESAQGQGSADLGHE